jgi:hypothetical protein
MKNKPWIYIASPYTKGDPAINTRFQCLQFDLLLSDGFVWPHAPLWTHFQHTLFPRPYEDWTGYDNAVIDRMDGCLRLSARHASMSYQVNESSGADHEVELFKLQGKPIYYSISEMYYSLGFKT